MSVQKISQITLNQYSDTSTLKQYDLQKSQIEYQLYKAELKQQKFLTEQEKQDIQSQIQHDQSTLRKINVLLLQCDNKIESLKQQQQITGKDSSIQKQLHLLEKQKISIMNDYNVKFLEQSIKKNQSRLKTDNQKKQLIKIERKSVSPSIKIRQLIEQSQSNLNDDNLEVQELQITKQDLSRTKQNDISIKQPKLVFYENQDSSEIGQSQMQDLLEDVSTQMATKDKVIVSLTTQVQQLQQRISDQNEYNEMKKQQVEDLCVQTTDSFFQAPHYENKESQTNDTYSLLFAQVDALHELSVVNSLKLADYNKMKLNFVQISNLLKTVLPKQIQNKQYEAKQQLLYIEQMNSQQNEMLAQFEQKLRSTEQSYVDFQQQFQQFSLQCQDLKQLKSNQKQNGKLSNEIEIKANQLIQHQKNLNQVVEAECRKQLKHDLLQKQFKKTSSELLLQNDKLRFDCGLKDAKIKELAAELERFKQEKTQIESDFSKLGAENKKILGKYNKQQKKDAQAADQQKLADTSVTVYVKPPNAVAETEVENEKQEIEKAQ